MDTEAEAELGQLADQLYRAADWEGAQNSGAKVTDGWKPESGFLRHRWHGYDEAILLYVLGLGSPISAQLVSTSRREGAALMRASVSDPRDQRQPQSGLGLRRSSPDRERRFVVGCSDSARLVGWEQLNEFARR